MIVFQHKFFKIFFVLWDRINRLIDSIFHNQSMNKHFFFLSNSMNSIFCLLVHLVMNKQEKNEYIWIIVNIIEDTHICWGKSESLPSTSRGHQQNTINTNNKNNNNNNKYRQSLWLNWSTFKLLSSIGVYVLSYRLIVIHGHQILRRSTVRVEERPQVCPASRPTTTTEGEKEKYLTKHNDFHLFGGVISYQF